ncbi:hypothetical protein GWN42_03470, partial [candidate division KSB1 bacterium]|nr:hypothetical protein [candidate division KSB1 bacterium]NIR68827.1 hypothetical protein [candidate division KSB1 bacterium]NIS27190.1 hypothetical protein [candidate division KSB1 bacterium]NIU27924.1 hypothetical protein [candidate division KSB1 bacterium]NIU89745.1 hypothetical protein [candidate division KSB1 bacterium]
MNRTLPRVWTIIFVCFLVTQNAIAQDKPKWRIKNRLQGSYEFDDNIFESTSESRDNVEASSLRFLFHSKAFRNSPQLRLSFSYRSGLQTYFQNEIENKLINDFDFGTAFRLNKFAFGVRGSGRLKIYLNHDLDYVTGGAEV